MITQSKGGKEAPPLMKPSYSGGNKQATGEETRFMDYLNFRFWNSRSHLRGPSAGWRNLRPLQRKNVLNQCLQLFFPEMKHKVPNKVKLAEFGKFYILFTIEAAARNLQ